MGRDKPADEAAWEEALTALELSGTSLIDWIRVDADELAGAEQVQLRLQMAMDREAKLMSTLSNLLKKASDTAAAIVGNLK